MPSSRRLRQRFDEDATAQSNAVVSASLVASSTTGYLRCAGESCIKEGSQQAKCVSYVLINRVNSQILVPGFT